MPINDVKTPMPKINTLKNILFGGVILIASRLAFCDEPAYQRDTIAPYLNTRDGIYLAVKIGGRLHFNEYRDLLKNRTQDLDQLISLWQKLKQEDEEQFLVVKSITGNLKAGDVFNAVQHSDYGYAQLGEETILLLHQKQSTGHFEFGPCDIISRNQLAKTPDTIDQLYQALNEHSLTPCLLVDTKSSN